MSIIISMKAKLITYNLSKLDQYHKVLVNRALFGYMDNSNKGSYHYERKGVIADIPHFKLLKGAIIVKSRDMKKISTILNKYRAGYFVLDVLIKPSMLH